MVDDEPLRSCRVLAGFHASHSQLVSPKSWTSVGRALVVSACLGRAISLCSFSTAFLGGAVDEEEEGWRACFLAAAGMLGLALVVNACVLRSGPSPEMQEILLSDYSSLGGGLTPSSAAVGMAVGLCCPRRWSL